MEIEKEVKNLSRLISAMKKLVSTKNLADYELADHLRSVKDQLGLVRIEQLNTHVEQLLEQTQARIDKSVKERREDLLQASRSSVIPCKRYGDFDRIDIFKVIYRGKKIQLEVGSELAIEFQESDGLKALERIKQEKEKLENSPFSRERFFLLLQYGSSLAQREKQALDGWVPINLMYVYVAILRHLDSESFLKNTTPRDFMTYSKAQFVFDLARFGRKEWTCGSYVLRTQTPNMATISAKKAVTLPNLDSVEHLGPQLAVIKIIKLEQ